MSGYEVEIPQLTALSGKMRDSGDSLAKAGSAFDDALGGDLGHEALQAAARELVSGLRGHFGGLAEAANGLGANLAGAGRLYQESDANAADTIVAPTRGVGA